MPTYLNVAHSMNKYFRPTYLNVAQHIYMFANIFKFANIFQCVRRTYNIVTVTNTTKHFIRKTRFPKRHIENGNPKNSQDENTHATANGNAGKCTVALSYIICATLNVCRRETFLQMRLTFCVLLLLLLRKEFAVALGACWGEICQGHHSKGDKPIPSVAVFREQHAAGHPHYHAVMSAPRNSLWHHLEKTLRSKYRVKGLIYYRYLAD